MKIINTIPFFFKNFQPHISNLRHYYDKYPDIFKEYFTYHCKDTDERLNQAISKYPQTLPLIKQVYKNITPIIEEVVEEYNRMYQVSFPIEVNFIVGGFGSNAFTYRQIIPNITFSLERLSPEPDHLRTIVAHEFGHAAHNILSDKEGMDWSKVEWHSPLTWLNQEGAATHFSRRTVPELNPSIYFQFNDEGDEWLSFAMSNQQDIKREFMMDYDTENPQVLFREWFSINGGKKFGHSRLGYFLADQFFQDLIIRFGESKAITAWKDSDFEEQVLYWLKQR
jgi:hypothetical protein